jgi:hypothetical protein
MRQKRLRNFNRFFRLVFLIEARSSQHGSTGQIFRNRWEVVYRIEGSCEENLRNWISNRKGVDKPSRGWKSERKVIFRKMAEDSQGQLRAGKLFTSSYGGVCLINV